MVGGAGLGVGKMRVLEKEAGGGAREGAQCHPPTASTGRSVLWYLP